MVVGLLAITSIPVVIGTCQALSAQKRQLEATSKEQHKFNLTARIQGQDGQLHEQGFGVLVNQRVGRSTSHNPFPFEP